MTVWRYPWPQKDEQIYRNYLNKLARLVCWLLEKEYHIALIPGEIIQDGAAIKDLKALISCTGVDTVSVSHLSHPPIQTVDELLSHLAAADLVIASRFHGVLLAQLLHKPLIALSYHSKIDELMADTGQAHYCLQISDFDLEVVKERFTELEANRITVSQQIARRACEYCMALDEQYAHIFRSH